MEDNTKELLIEAIEKGFADLKKLDAGTEAYNTQVNCVTKLCETKFKDDKLDDDRRDAELRRGFESEKLEAERETKQLEISSNAKQVLLMTGKELGIAALMLSGNAIDMTRIMRFEQNGTIGTKAFGLLPKLRVR